MNLNVVFQESDTLKVMTFNIRLDVASDGENAWQYRKEIAAGVFNKFNIDIAGIQEALFNQIEDLNKLLPEYGWYGAGRNDGKRDGEFSAIFYRKDKLKLVKGNTFWLSEKPDEPGSVGWDAALTRICTWGEFKDLITGKTFFFFNTHFDHIGEKARENSADLIVFEINKIARGNPVILTGDFNFNDSSLSYKKLINNKLINLKDVRSIAGVKTSGPEWSFHGFNTVQENKREKIDFIFVNDCVKAFSHSILDYSENGRYPSDHLPVTAELEY
ncbi:MAG TPA: endonuclease/exonuclease/phosphatase family protein [Ignavibacteriaceae bacterium]|nr:endonuclease/exonuclease/phosphatase family protein [Ignavibacteriaceae bacterium]